MSHFRNDPITLEVTIPFLKVGIPFSEWNPINLSVIVVSCIHVLRIPKLLLQSGSGPISEHLTFKVRLSYFDRPSLSIFLVALVLRHIHTVF